MSLDGLDKIDHLLDKFLDNKIGLNDKTYC